MAIFAVDMECPIDMDEIWQCDAQQFNELALRLFHYQSKNNKVFADYLNLIDVQPDSIDNVQSIPYLPIAFFKTHKVLCQGISPKRHFLSSSTSGIGQSSHYVQDLEAYHQNCKSIFERNFGPINKYEIVGLLPSYLERKNSSLVEMVNYFAKQGNGSEPYFYLYDHPALYERLKSTKPILMFGVSFALLDFAEAYCSNKSDLFIIETGGMKGRKKELTREQVHQKISRSFPKALIRSEYGMTELFSQAYSDSSGRYHPPPWMRISIRADNDPLSKEYSKRGAINIIDLANLNSCAFIATDDLGQSFDDGSFEVLGRLDLADQRGCSLLVS